MFRKRRFKLRHLFACILAISAAYAYMQPSDDAQMEEQIAYIAPASPVALPSPNTMPSHSYAVMNLKDAFDSKPEAPGYSFEDGTQEQVENLAAIEPAAGAQEASDPVQLVMAPRPAPKPLMRHINHVKESIEQMLNAEPETAADDSGDDAEPASEKKVRVGKGDTLMELLVKNDVPRDEAYNAIQALRKVYDPRGLNPGHQITVFFHKDPSIADPRFVGLRIDPDIVHSLVVNRSDDGAFRANKEAKSLHRTLKAYRGSIDNSLYVDAKAADVPDAVILELIRMFSWSVDFQRDIQRGDGFEVMFEQYVTDEGVIVPNKGNVVYAQMLLSGRTLPLYRHEDANGDYDYFDTTGQSAKKPLMKTPIDGARISSGYGVRRHPVLGYNKMHKGIDFAAPRGTPIYAAGDGVVERAGKFSSYGNYVRIRHRAGLSTAYAHLNGFRKGVRAGSRVKQGQVIGYVGTTGRSTGPHLHYEILMGGKQVNPRTVKVSGGRELKGKELATFKANVAKLDKTFVAKLPKSAAPAMAANSQ